MKHLKSQKRIKLLLVSGMSGAGKTQAMRALEDMGYFCVDNYPFPMIEDLIQDVLLKEGSGFTKVAIAIDVRGKEFLSNFDKNKIILDKERIDFSVLFLDAQNQTLINRYKETRRMHPLQEKLGIIDAIDKEREILGVIRKDADRVIDTSNSKIKDFKELMFDLYGEAEPKMVLTVESFGFKHGLPLDADLVFDVRFLPNPFYFEDMKYLTGLDEKVNEYVLGQDGTKKFVSSLIDMLNFLIPEYVKEGKKQLVLAIGCTGGQHRSVAIAKEIANSISLEDVRVILKHRDIKRKCKK